MRSSRRARALARRVGAWLIATLVASCGGAPPPVRFYTFAASDASKPTVAGSPTLVVRPLSADSAYDTDRIVYRLSPYRLDYYNYHRWSAHPGLLVGDYLRRAYARTGLFREVVAESRPGAELVLAGRIIALDEVDETTERWRAHIALQLSLHDSRTGATVWSATYERSEPMLDRNPEGLARALSEALAHIVDESAPALAAQTRAARGEALPADAQRP